MTAASTATDVHQHLWPPALIEALRSRSAPPRLTGWTLHLSGEPAYEVDPAAHDIDARRADDAGIGCVLLSLSSPLGIEDLPPDEAAELLAAWHDGARELPAPYGAWASVSATEPDLAVLRDLLAGGAVGLQVPATWLLTPGAVDRAAGLLRVCELAGRPVFVHPGPVPGAAARGPLPESLPAWWPAVVDYPAQLQAAWWAWHIAGRGLLPDLRICFAAGAGLAPVQHERYLARGGRSRQVDQSTFLDTSSYGRNGLDALIRVLGIDPVVFGSDRPYATPTDSCLDPAARHAVRVRNPRRLLEGERQ